MHLPGLELAGPLEGLPWRETRHVGVEWIDLAPDADGPARTVLIRMRPGHGYPRHRHLGAEDVLVLSGGYADEDGRVVTAKRPGPLRGAGAAPDARVGVAPGVCIGALAPGSFAAGGVSSSLGS